MSHPSLCRLLQLFALSASVVLAGPSSHRSHAQVLDRQKLLAAETFWDNRDWDWYKTQIPFFECPDADITTTYYYRWELVTKHLTYGSPATGYTFTEFIDRPFWSGTYGAISCPAGHQLYEVRWLRDPRFARDYAAYWFRTEGAQPRRYSTWLANAVWAVNQVHPDRAFTTDLLRDLVKNYEAWEQRQFVADVGLFWQTGHDDGMEFNINSRQSADPNAGAPGYRPTLNAYLWADALAIARIAELRNDEATAQRFRDKAARLKENLQTKLWDSKREFFFHMAHRDEHRDGHTVKARTLTYQSGKYAGNPHGRELIGYVPWQFNLPDAGYEAAWKFLMDPDYFAAEFGPTTTGRKDPLFQISKTCCVWSGQSWPYATSQTLKAMANLLQHYNQTVVNRDDYVNLLKTYARTHRKNGRPYIAEAAHPDTGSWEGHDNYNHSEHYFHSSFNDLVITGLVGLSPRDDDVIEVKPLAPASWDYFALDGVRYRGHDVSVVWDKAGTRYPFGPGLHIVIDGNSIASAKTLEPLSAKLPERSSPEEGQRATTVYNFAVNNDGRYYPRVAVSHTGEKTSGTKLIDGNYWYHRDPPNRWTSEGSQSDREWITIDFGMPRDIHEVTLYVLDDGEASAVKTPGEITIEHWDGNDWKAIADFEQSPQQLTSHRANHIRFKPIATTKLRVTLTHPTNAAVGLSEIEAWGTSAWPIPHSPEPAPSLATNRSGRGFPKASASHTSRYDQVAMANDGITNFQPTPHNRWTSYESPNDSDWLQIDFGEAREVGRVELAIYDDRGGVQAPRAYNVQHWDGQKWIDAAEQQYSPKQPAGGQWNEVRFNPVKTQKLRVVFTHKGKARSGVSEILVWRE
jgi:hypothetical protein